MNRELSTSELWAQLKHRLIHDYGRQGAADWLDFAAKQAGLEAKRDAIMLAPAEPFVAEHAR